LKKILLKHKNKVLQNSVKKHVKTASQIKTAFQTQFFWPRNIKYCFMYNQIPNYIFCTANIKTGAKQTNH
jgi:hypothetical protein